MLSGGDKKFGSIACEKGFLTADKLLAATKALEKLEKNGVVSTLDRVLLEKAFLKPGQVAEIQRIQKRRIHLCSCGNRMNVFQYPPGKRLHCSGCKAPFLVENEPGQGEAGVPVAGGDAKEEAPTPPRASPPATKPAAVAGARRAGDGTPKTPPRPEPGAPAKRDTPRPQTPVPVTPGAYDSMTPPTQVGREPPPGLTVSAGSTVGHYEILEELGSGGMGIVYKVRHTILGRIDAMKVIRSDVAAKHNYKEIFLREAKISGQLKHPHMTQVYDVIDEGKVLAYAMEYVDGQTLSAMVKAGPIPVRDAIAWTGEIASALNALHAAGLVHRDVKPANIMIDTTGRAILTDFGLAKNFEEAGTSGVTKDDIPIGTPAFMAPEQIDNARYADHRADIYGLGATLFFILTGQLPFSGANTLEIFSKVMTKEPPRLSEFLPSAPRSLTELVGRMLVKIPDYRIQNALEVMSAISKILQSDL
ncbi:MAG: protein kinase [Planctomycetes bacterium]|nr:protein kinase [Planctomycetota bacterium]